MGRLELRVGTTYIELQLSQTAVTWIFRVPDPTKPEEHTIANLVTDKANTEHHTGSPHAYLTVGPTIIQEPNVHIMVVQVGITILLLLLPKINLWNHAN